MEIRYKPIEKDLSVKEFWQGFYAGFTIIIVSGLGDKLFFLNMMYASIISFCQGFWIALAVSEIINLINISLGELLKHTLSLSILEYIAILIFIILGVWLIIKGKKMPETRLIQKYEEERKLLFNEKNNEIGNNIENNSYKQLRIIENSENNTEEAIGVFDSWWQYLIVYFFASIGDKTQIASILITSKYEFISILNGTSIGIVFLVFIAMIFGKSIASLLTNKQISIICGILFLLYAFVFFIDKKIGKSMK